MKLFKQTYHPPTGIRDHRTLFLLPTESVSHNLCLLTLLPSANPCMILHCIHCPPLLGCECIWLINFCQSHVSRIRWYLFGHPHNLKMRISLSPMGDTSIWYSYHSQADRIENQFLFLLEKNIIRKLSPTDSYFTVRTWKVDCIRL